MITVGFRFLGKRDAKVLRHLADATARGEFNKDSHQFYSQCALAAERKELLCVQATNIAEAEELADGLVLIGIERPAIEPWHRSR